MKLELNNKDIGLYDIDYEYRQYLTQFDNKVNKKEGRRFVGIIVGINDYKYFIPLTSKPLRHNGKRRNVRSTVEIFNESHELIAALLINNMIPVPKGAYHRININADRYKDYLMNEYIYLKKSETIDEIEKKVNHIYDVVSNNKDVFLVNFCCDFKLLEDKSRIWGK